MRILVMLAALVAWPAMAENLAISSSERPQARPLKAEITFIQITSAAGSVNVSARPVPRRVTPVQVSNQTTVVEQSSSTPVGFQNWIAGFRARAAAKGIHRATLNSAFQNAEYLPHVVRLDRNQSEFTKTLWDYLDTAVSGTRVSNGRAAVSENGAALNAIERRYGVPKEIVVAVWGLETSYGSFRGSDNVISSLATLAYDGRRAAFFENELMNALKILQSGDIDPHNMKGSWAGAMGHTQFMPSSYNRYAVDFTGDGKRDIWGRNPADALASTANYLRSHGWRTGEPWGMEVVLPRGFDYSQTGERVTKSAAQWNRMGVRTASGRRLPDHGPASIRVPGGAGHVAFVTYRNFKVIERYNPADAYVIGIGHLADRIAGAPGFKGAWPRGDRALSGDERRELQRRLTQAGFDTGKIDGKIGPDTLAAVRAFQRSRGLVADGYVSGKLLGQLRGL